MRTFRWHVTWATSPVVTQHNTLFLGAVWNMFTSEKVFQPSAVQKLQYSVLHLLQFPITELFPNCGKNMTYRWRRRAHTLLYLILSELLMTFCFRCKWSCLEMYSTFGWHTLLSVMTIYQFHMTVSSQNESVVTIQEIWTIHTRRLTSTLYTVL